MIFQMSMIQLTMAMLELMIIVDLLMWLGIWFILLLGTWGSSSTTIQIPMSWLREGILILMCGGLMWRMVLGILPLGMIWGAHILQ